MIRIGLDTMGGDFAPEATVKGAIMALDAIGDDCRIVLFGDDNLIREILAEEGCPSDKFDIVATTEVIEMHEHPVRAFQQKSDSSLAVGFRHLSEGRITGFASAGSTGAMMVGSMQVVKVINGVLRPAISTIVPTTTGKPVIILDIGLNVDCKPDVLEQYATIGSIYAKSVLGIENPRIALLNIGTESSKGNLLIKAAYELMQASHIFTSEVADVVVCDGFVGNILLKLAEGLYGINYSLGSTNSFWEGLNYENTGGTPVLGVNAPVVIGHGKSTPLAIKNMIISTEHAIKNRLIERLTDAFR